MVTMKMRHGLYSKGKKLSNTHTLADINYSAFEFQSGLINGRGRFYENQAHNGAPLSEFSVVKNNTYRFRLINAGDIQAFRVSIDEHTLQVVATDGHPIQPVVVESLILNPGERYDIILVANQSVGNYWIRGQTLQREHNHTAEAILRYAGAPLNQDPTSSKQNCTISSPCVVLNCPFSVYPADSNTYCYNYDKIRSLKPVNLQKPPGRNIREFFLNFAFPGTTETPGSTNGKSFVNQDYAILSKSQKPRLTCSRNDCGDDKVCHCPYDVSYDNGDLIQFVFLNMGSGKGWDHPIHMHGHSFQVVKVGFPSYNETTGTFIEDNNDIDCGFQFCNNAKWSNNTWNNDNVPGLDLVLGPLKDDIMVPSGGYVVARIMADNPGMWIIHCHIELHMTDGMAALLNESQPLWPTPPRDFPTCHNFYDQGTN
uniref:Plastocyanin-like domain-containing protein n=2 Tax=Arion vulgaris TaxID=1028688 RepID=A0A0B7AYM5_9EUPU